MSQTRTRFKTVVLVVERNPSMYWRLALCSFHLVGRSVVVVWFGSFSFPCWLRNIFSSIISHFSLVTSTLTLIHQPKYLLEIDSVCELFSMKSTGGSMLVKQPILNRYRRMQGPQACWQVIFYEKNWWFKANPAGQQYFCSGRGGYDKTEIFFGSNVYVLIRAKVQGHFQKMPVCSQNADISVYNVTSYYCSL